MGDLENFSMQFLEESNHRLNKQIKGFTSEVWEIFLGYDWPGNLRELKNIIKRSVLLCNELLISKESLPQELQNPENLIESQMESNSLPHNSSIPTATNYKRQWVEQEKELIQKVLNDTKFNKSKTARILKMDRKTLYSKLEKIWLELIF